MAASDHIKALIESFAAGDEARFFRTALQLAASEARQGHGKLAQELRDTVDAVKARRAPVGAPRPIPLVQPRGDLGELVTASYPDLKLTDMVLAPAVAEPLERVLRENRGQTKLREHGLYARRKLLLVGPPGTGKTMSARAFAGELHLPLYLVRFESLITKFMGETAAKLRLVFDAMHSSRGVYLFDEFDAIGAQRLVAVSSERQGNLRTQAPLLARHLGGDRRRNRRSPHGHQDRTRGGYCRDERRVSCVYAAIVQLASRA
jgi:SpoVK/Ycf46/Vps4 family AAA+-type ATPase